MNNLYPLKFYPIYLEKEAKKKGIKYKLWSDRPHEKCDWILSDDGYVSQLRAVSSVRRYWRGEWSKKRMNVTCAWVTGRRSKPEMAFPHPFIAASSRMIGVTVDHGASPTAPCRISVVLICTGKSGR
mgnify:CR=1 FL=1